MRVFFVYGGFTKHKSHIVVLVILVAALIAGLCIPGVTSAARVKPTAIAPRIPNPIQEPTPVATQKLKDNFYRGMLIGCMETGALRQHCLNLNQDAKAGDFWSIYGIK
jgi:hypothetical protein